MLLQLEEKIRDMRLKGIPNIERANVQLDDKTENTIYQQLDQTYLELVKLRQLIVLEHTQTILSRFTITLE